MQSVALLYFHQGWEDIALCLPWISLCSPRHRRVYVLMRQDARLLVQFYIRGLPNVSAIYAPLEELSEKGIGVLSPALRQTITHYELLGQLDGGRTDAYKGAHSQRPYSWETLFHEPYGLTRTHLLDAFTLYRDPTLEEVSYTKVVSSEPYICVHDDSRNNKFVCVDTTLPIVNLGRLDSNMFFDAIRILQHAKEIHLVDSTWAILCYWMDAKYGLFHQIPIHVYCFDSRESTVSTPIHLPNWTLHSAKESRANRDKTGTAIVSFASGSYVEQQAFLVDSLYRYSPSIPIFPFQSLADIASPSHSDNPYAFKVYAIQRARDLGYSTVIWCDSVLRLTRPIQTLLPDIRSRGVYLQEDGWNVAQWANDRALDYFGVSRNEAEKVSAVYACFMAYDFHHPLAQEFFRRWKKACDDGIFRGKWKNEGNCESHDPRCRGHRHDQTCAELISYQLGIPRALMRVLPGRDSSERYFTTWKHI